MYIDYPIYAFTWTPCDCLIFFFDYVSNRKHVSIKSDYVCVCVVYVYGIIYAIPKAVRM
jgi:hypothetical protein